MAKLLKIVTAHKTDFGSGNVVEGNQPIAFVMVPDFLDASQVLAGLTYRSMLSEEVSQDEASDVLDYLSKNYKPSKGGDPNLESSVDDDDHSDDEDLEGDVNDGDDLDGLKGENDPNANHIVGDLAKAGFDEAIVKALEANGIKTIAELKAKIDSGVDLETLDEIGKTRKAKILAVMKQQQPS